MAQSYRVTVIEQCQVAPPPNSVPTTSLPLTFLDIPWLRILSIPIQRLFFYELTQSTHYFTQSILPTLKHSLSLTLQHFFPFAANLVCPPPHTHKPHILYTEGNSIPFTVVEAAGDFNHLIANYPRDVREFHHFVPHLQPPHVSSDNLTRVIPLMAIQVTVFPNKGICIGISFCHAAADGRAFHHFMKSWASVCRKGGDLSCLDMSPPFHDRAVIKDTNGLEQNFLENWWNWDSATKDDTDLINDIVADKVRSTFVLRRAHIEGLKQWVRGQCMNREDLEPLHISTFVVTCALIWACLIKSQHSGVSNLSDDSKLCHFTFLADCRNRLNFPIPSTYFGNCLEICFVVPLERRELVGETGIFQAVKAIGNRVRQLETEALRGAEAWLLDWKEQPKPENLVTIAGSPSFGVYETDFGWGRPKKSEVVHIDITGIISVAESRDEDGAIEVGLALTRKNIDDFTAIWEKSLKLF